MEYAIDVYGENRRTGPIYLGQTTTREGDTVGQVETRIIRDVLAGVEGIGRTMPFEMTAVHLNGKRYDDNVNFRDSTQLFTEAIKNSHSSVYKYNGFDVIIKVHDGYNNSNNESNRSSTRSRGRSTSRSSNTSKSRSSSTSKRARSRSTSKRGRSRSRSNNSTRRRQRQ